MNWSQVISHEKRDGMFEIKICREAKRNAINLDAVEGIVEGWRLAENDDEVRVIVLTGEGSRAFCAGGDLGTGSTGDVSQPRNAYADMIRTVLNSSKVSIARVNGACMAGGLGLLCMADLAVATEDAIFGLPEVKVGLFPMQVLSLLQRLVPQRIVREWCLTGESFDAATALDVGLVNRTVPRERLDEEIERLAELISSRSPAAIRRGKYAMEAMANMSVEQALAFGESQFALAGQTDDAREGRAAFAEKRSPTWTGR